MHVVPQAVFCVTYALAMCLMTARRWAEFKELSIFWCFLRFLLAPLLVTVSAARWLSDVT
jgi:hypothetical protein